MSDIFQLAGSVPSFVIYGIVGAVFGAAGALLAYLFDKIFKTKNASKILPIIFVVASTQVHRN